MPDRPGLFASMVAALQFQRHMIDTMAGFQQRLDGGFYVAHLWPSGLHNKNIFLELKRMNLH
jgi:hypothetical protein